MPDAGRRAVLAIRGALRPCPRGGGAARFWPRRRAGGGRPDLARPASEAGAQPAAVAHRLRARPAALWPWLPPAAAPRSRAAWRRRPVVSRPHVIAPSLPRRSAPWRGATRRARAPSLDRAPWTGPLRRAPDRGRPRGGDVPPRSASPTPTRPPRGGGCPGRGLREGPPP